MPKPHTLPHLYNVVPQLSISKLKEWGYLKPNQSNGGTVTWSKNGETTARISVLVNMCSDDHHVEVDYTYGGDPRKYKIRLVFVPSNLGKGQVWYFLCPRTFKRCRILYSIDGYFHHREAFNGCMYDTQTYSHKDRALVRMFDWSVKSSKANELLYSKHFKTHYNGKPTKRYLRALRDIKQGEGIDVGRLMLR
jgi:hypothetical protein